MRTRILIVLAAVLGLSPLLFLTGERSSTAQIQLIQPKLEIFMEENFQGPSIVVTGSLIDMPVLKDQNGVEINWNDQVGSVIVHGGAWLLSEHGRVNTSLDDTPLGQLDHRTKPRIDGWCCLISASSAGPLSIPRPALGGFTRSVSSVVLVSEKNLPDWALPPAYGG